MPDDLPEDQLPEPVALTPEQIAAEAEADERDRERRLEWAVVILRRLPHQIVTNFWP